jgi:hypothetical protein
MRPGGECHRREPAVRTGRTVDSSGSVPIMSSIEA